MTPELLLALRHAGQRNGKDEIRGHTSNHEADAAGKGVEQEPKGIRQG